MLHVLFIILSPSEVSVKLVYNFFYLELFFEYFAECYDSFKKNISLFVLFPSLDFNACFVLPFTKF